jgi:DNA-binding TFAR19-related protein (PDSD5 family)
MEVDAIRQKRNMQMQQQQQIQNANVQAQTAATLSNAKLGDDNVLSQLAEEGAAA